jgi:D-arabinose 1-dehydrogenase-like Zn-dependent alcohol dehydrogenase
VGPNDRATCPRPEVKKDVRIETVPDPRIEDASDIVLKVTATAICGSVLHICDGFVPQMKSGDILGHEFMGEVVEVGAECCAAQDRRQGGRAIRDRLRALLFLRKAPLVSLRPTPMPKS